MRLLFWLSLLVAACNNNDTNKLPPPEPKSLVPSGASSVVAPPPNESELPDCRHKDEIYVCSFKDGTSSATKEVNSFSGDLAADLATGGLTTGFIDTIDCPDSIRIFFTTATENSNGHWSFVYGFRYIGTTRGAITFNTNVGQSIAIKNVLWTCPFHNDSTAASPNSISSPPTADVLNEDWARTCPSGNCYGQLGQTGNPKTTYVHPYTRQDGTHVGGHYRSH